MSLDITLELEIKTKCPHCKEHIITGSESVYETNITHNLSKMAHEAGIYEAIWCAEDKSPKDVIEEIEKGYAKMVEQPNYFKFYSSSNGWGTYEQFIPWLENLIEYYKEYPNTKILISK